MSSAPNQHVPPHFTPTLTKLWSSPVKTMSLTSWLFAACVEVAHFSLTLAHNLSHAIIDLLPLLSRVPGAGPPMSWLASALCPTSAVEPEAVRPESKEVAASSFKASYIMLPEHADSKGRVFGGEAMKLIDVVAGIASRKHAGKPCVTISVDRVIFLCPVYVGDVLHLSVSVNRSWGSSMETGVRIIKEGAKSGKQEYACHAYLTFVARPTAVVEPSPQLIQRPWGLRPPVSGKVQVPKVIPTTVLERKRYLLAGRRRGQRLNQSKTWIELFEKFRGYVQSIAYPKEDSDSRIISDEELENLQKQMIANSYFNQDRGVRLEGEMVIAEIDDQSDPIQVPLSEITHLMDDQMTGASRRVSMSSAGAITRRKSAQGNKDRALRHTLETEETLATFVWIVRPEHCNSMTVLFGGTLMRWLEEVACLSARSVCTGSWATATIDSMVIRASARPGDAVKLRAVVIKVWEGSAEVYCVANAERPDGSEIFLSDAFFSLVPIDPEKNLPLRGELRQVQSSNTWGQAMAQKSDQRRQERLADKSMLQRVWN